MEQAVVGQSAPAPGGRGQRGALPAPSSNMAIVPVIVPRNILSTVVQGLSTPFGAPHLQSAMAAALQVWTAGAHKTDDNVISMVNELCSEGDGRCETKHALYKRLGVPQKKADQVWGMTANALVTIEQVERRAIEDQSARALAKPLLLVDSCRYDETPLPASAKHTHTA